MRHKNGFSIMEMMVVFMLITLALLAIRPLFSKITSYSKAATAQSQAAETQNTYTEDSGPKFEYEYLLEAQNIELERRPMSREEEVDIPVDGPLGNKAGFQSIFGYFENIEKIMGQ